MGLVNETEQCVREYVIRRVLALFPVLFFITVVTFSLFRILPGDVLDVLYADSPLAHSEIEQLRERLGYNRPLLVQYLDWASGIVRLDGGDSLWTRRPVMQEIADRLPVTIELALLAFTIALVVGIPIGVVSAVQQDKPIDAVLRCFSIIMLATPGFWLATIVLVYLSTTIRWVPPLGGVIPLWENPLGNLQQFFLPAIILGLSASASTMRLTRNTLLEVIRQDYVRTAFAKGLGSQRVWWVHTVRNAMIPVITTAGSQLGQLLSGAVIIETIFALPGVGFLTLSAIQHRDITQLEMNIVFVGSMFVILNLLIDLSYAWFDPRIRYR